MNFISSPSKMLLCLSQVVEILKNQLKDFQNPNSSHATEITFTGISIDSRTVEPGNLFIAIKGENFDGHHFVNDAISRGALAVIAHHHVVPLPTVPVFVVADTRIALGKLATGWRQLFQLPLIAVTGSNGKTTVKEMIAAIFCAHVGNAAYLATQGNFNNDIGLPLTLLKLNQEHRYSVIELGMNHPKETAYLAAIAQANIALINNAQREHQEFMTDVEAVALEHADVIKALPQNGIAVFPASSPYADLWKQAAGQRHIIDFSLDATISAAIMGRYDAAQQTLQIKTPESHCDVHLKTLGQHNASNALAAAACAIAAKIPLSAIQKGLENFSPVQGRLQMHTIEQGNFASSIVINDSYNANPDSVLAAIDVLAQTPAPRVLILGDMGEVGQQGEIFHREIGLYALQKNIEYLFTAGQLSAHTSQAFGSHAQHFENSEALYKTLQSLPVKKYTFLVKGSRFMRMEKIVSLLLQQQSSSNFFHH